MLLRCDTTYTLTGGQDRHRRDPGVHRHGLRQRRRQRASRRPGREGRAQHRDGPALRRPVADRLPPAPPSTSPSSPPAAPGPPRQGHQGGRQRVLRLAHEGRREQDRFVFEDRAGEAPSVRVGRWGPPASRTPVRRPATRFTTRPSSLAGPERRADPRESTSGDLSNAHEDITGWHLGTLGIRERHVRGAASGSTITQVTTPHTGTHGGRWDNSGASDALSMNDYLEITLTGTFLAGVRYRIYPGSAPIPARPPPQFQVGDFAPAT